MPVIHISEAEAARDLPRLLAKVRAGQEVRIDDGTTTVAIVKARPETPGRKTLSEAIRLAEERNLQVRLDDQFGRDLDQVVCNHEHEGIRNPWEE